MRFVALSFGEAVSDLEGLLRVRETVAEFARPVLVCVLLAAVHDDARVGVTVWDTICEPDNDTVLVRTGPVADSDWDAANGVRLTDAVPERVAADDVLLVVVGELRRAEGAPRMFTGRHSSVKAPGRQEHPPGLVSANSVKLGKH